MFEPAPREEMACLDQRGDDGFIGVTLLAFIVDDTTASKARHLFRVEAVSIDRVRDTRVDAERRERAVLSRPQIEIFTAVTRRGMHETGSRIVGDVLALE